MKKKALRLISLSLLLLVCVSFATSTLAYASGESDDARDAAKKILSQKKFSNQQKDAPLGDNVRRISDWLGETKTKKRTQERAPEQKRNSQTEEQSTPPKFQLPNLSGLGIVILVLLVVLTVGALAYFLSKLFMNRKGKKKKDEEEAEEIDVNEIEWHDEDKILKAIDDSDLLDELADKAASEGRFDIALRYRFRSGLLRLDKINLIRFHPSTTNNAYQLVLENLVFNTLVKTFNDVTYGKIECDKQLYENAKQSWLVLIGPANKNAKVKEEK